MHKCTSIYVYFCIPCVPPLPAHTHPTADLARCTQVGLVEYKQADWVKCIQVDLIKYMQVYLVGSMQADLVRICRWTWLSLCKRPLSGMSICTCICG